MDCFTSAIDCGSARLDRFLETEYALTGACCVALFTFFLYILSRPKRMNISGKTVVITGGGMGIGRLMALDFAKRGCTLILWDIHKKHVDAGALEIEAMGEKACS